jgi:hypothetical protein
MNADILKSIWHWAGPSWHWAGHIYLKDIFTLGIAATALFFSLRDRRSRLTLRERKGNWCKLYRSGSGDVIFRGLIEVYNVSSRANAIRYYKFSYRTMDEWKPMTSSLFTEKADKDTPQDIVFNVTPLTLPPYSGMVMAKTQWSSNVLLVALILPLAKPTTRTRSPSVMNSWGSGYEVSTVSLAF